MLNEISAESLAEFISTELKFLFFIWKVWSGTLSKVWCFQIFQEKVKQIFKNSWKSRVMQDFPFKKSTIQQLRGKITREECQKGPLMASSLCSFLFKEKKAVDFMYLKICKNDLQMNYADLR